MKNTIAIVAVALLSVSQYGCGRLTISTMKSPGYQNRWISTRKPIVLLEAPQEPYAVQGIVQIRTSRPWSVPELVRNLSLAARKLHADAVIPPNPDLPRNVEHGSQKYGSKNPYFAYYIFDEGDGVVLEGQAIRFTKDEK